MTYGLLTGLAMVVYSLILYFANVPLTAWYSYLILVIFLIGVLLFCVAYSKSKAHEVTFGSVFKAGFRMVAFTTLIMLAWTIISIFAFPEMKEKVLEESYQMMVQKKIPAKQIEESMQMTRDKYTLITTMGVMFSNLFYGVVFLLIGSAIAKKKKVIQY
jgi:phosphatidylglycerophosphate synthase